MKKSVQKIAITGLKSLGGLLSGAVLARVLVLSTFLCVSGQAHSASDTAAYEEAQDTVEKYRELRKECAVSQDEQRRACFAELDDSTEDYQKAKKVIAMQKSHDESPLLGQAK